MPATFCTFHTSTILRLSESALTGKGIIIEVLQTELRIIETLNRNSPSAALASYRPRLIGQKDDSVIIYSRPFGGNKQHSAIKLLTGTDEIEIDQDDTYLSSIPSSFEPIYRSPFKTR